ncbi:imidazole glycerol phosphate synthase subunit HisH [Xinfangfangia sp. D13-10-4-6]|uniref:imidazole glycerol phosphate synthase subunit HisH n=1 Tax=Pseudogemmobacter hezensis TaxID=2737662 RepID=UPI001554673E|nr:imidazole glycerol phosphate synthase subunit HisH [Pseudogemmobacter hezensis]NPD15188.1 imidazole glycerol phosphate synthase subunit HisH [Pseudogemmobacter hezensis]
MSLTVLVDYDSGNLHSAEKAFQRMAGETGAGEVIVSARPEDVARATRIVLPGDGAFPACRRALDAVPGLFAAIEEAVLHNGRPFLGICIGMQMLATRGLEYGETAGFDWIGGEVTRIAPQDPALKVPHMGWNDLQIHKAHPVMTGVKSGDHAYFVHSWQFRTANAPDLIASVDYAGPVTAIVGRDNIIGTQFHPEKSAATGLRIIANFLTWRP